MRTSTLRAGNDVSKKFQNSDTEASLRSVLMLSGTRASAHIRAQRYEQTTMFGTRYNRVQNKDTGTSLQGSYTGALTQGEGGKR